jgi:FkbM family methyltransferase
MIKKQLSNLVPGLGRMKRRATAIYHAVTKAKTSYAQHGEDVLFLEGLKTYKTQNAIYVDVGANHPTVISNTYLLYRNGMRGVVVEPHRELVELHKKTRPEDYHIDCGCGEKPSMEVFNLSKTPVLSSFKNLSFGGKVWKKIYLPVLPLKIILSKIEFEYIYLLSVDVEGMDLEVLRGAEDLLDRCLFLCIEANGADEEESITAFLEKKNFELLKRYDCNLVFIHQVLRDEKRN